MITTLGDDAASNGVAAARILGDAVFGENLTRVCCKYLMYFLNNNFGFQFERIIAFCAFGFQFQNKFYLFC